MALLRLRARNCSRDSDARRAATAPSGHERGEAKGTGTWSDLAGRSAGDSPPPELPRGGTAGEVGLDGDTAASSGVRHAAGNPC